MKRVIYCVVLLVCFSVIVTATAQEKVQIKATFNGFHCDGKQGLCAMEKSYTSGNGFIQLVSANRLVWELPLASLTNANHVKLFGIDKSALPIQSPLYITFPAAYELPPEIQNALDKVDPITVKRGRYIARREGDRYKIELTIE
ncbi:hypothetical protein [Altibacter sp. HG106]|uniref:hypothetical protein n=1 Tax=Altibacter sp. HG106 TaxID=3023937 RepID=UPI0023506D84|nr:hypothetical protein [Altibacter sp. HG106]MDC7994712.1 hypothetical protein [Altibacter sp. HG106]